MTGQAGSHEKV